MDGTGGHGVDSYGLEVQGQAAHEALDSGFKIRFYRPTRRGHARADAAGERQGTGHVLPSVPGSSLARMAGAVKRTKPAFWMTSGLASASFGILSGAPAVNTMWSRCKRLSSVAKSARRLR